MLIGFIFFPRVLKGSVILLKIFPWKKFIYSLVVRNSHHCFRLLEKSLETVNIVAKSLLQYVDVDHVWQGFFF